MKHTLDKGIKKNVSASNDGNILFSRRCFLITVYSLNICIRVSRKYSQLSAIILRNFMNKNKKIKKIFSSTI